MQVQILKSGAAIVAHKGQVWLLDAPIGVGPELSALGITPDYLLTTQVAAPGLLELPDGLKTIRGLPLRGDGLEAQPHGSDYLITDDTGASLFFSQRGDVSCKAVSGRDLSIIGNKYRANAFDDTVITRPWPVASFHVTRKVYSSLSDAPDNLKEIDGAKLTLAQINAIARQADAVEEEGDVESPWAVAISHFKETHHKEGDRWVENKDEDEAEKTVRETLDRFSAALSEQFPMEQAARAAATPNYYLEDVDVLAGYAIVRDWGAGSQAYAVPYTPLEAGYTTADDGTITFAPRSEWREAVQRWVVKADRFVCPNCGSRRRERGSDPAVCAECGERMIADQRAQAGVVGHAASRMVLGGIKAEAAESVPEVKVGKAEKDGKVYQTRDGKLYPASDFLVVEDTDEPSTWHLPITKEPDGEPDRGMMGAAAAALTAPRGFRGQRYTGPGKQAAIEKLRGLYRKLDIDEEDWPDGLRSKSLQEGIAILKSRYPLLDIQEPDRLAVFKTDDGKWRWATITSAVMWDKQDELVTRKAMDFALKLAAITGERGPLRHEHIPGLDVGMCDWQMRKGDLLFEAGYFFDTPFAQHMRKRYAREDLAYKVSAGLRYQDGDLVDGVYHRMAIFERSATKTPAVPFTALGVRPMNISDDMLKQIAEDTEWSFDEVKALVERAMKSEHPPDSLEALKSALEQSKTDEAIDALLTNLSESDKAMLREKLSPGATGEEQAGGAGETNEVATLKAAVDELKTKIDSQNTAMLTLAEALKGSTAQGNVTVAEAFEQFVASLPRKEAAQFLTGKSGPGQGGASLEAIQAQLNEMQKNLQSLNAPGSTFDYNAFTSKRLNPQSRGGA